MTRSDHARDHRDTARPCRRRRSREPDARERPAHPAGLRRRTGGRRRGRGAAGLEDGARPDRARHRPAGHRRGRGLPPRARVQRRARAHADRPGHRARQGRGLRGRRRRLRDQAVLDRGADGPREGRAAPRDPQRRRDAGARRAGHPHLRRPHDRSPRARGHARRRDARAHADRVRPARHAQRRAARGLQPRPAARARVGPQLVRRRPPRRRPHLQPAPQARRRPALPGLRLHGPRCRVSDGRRAVIAGAIAMPPSLEDGVLVWDPCGVVLDVNPAMERMLGAPRELIVGRPSDPSMLLAPGGGSVPLEQLPAARVERTGGRVEQEYGVAVADGAVLWFSVRSAPLPDGTIVSAFTPISEAEAKARAAARISTVVDDSPDLVWMFDAGGLIEYASPSVAAALGLRQDEVIGRLWRALTHPEDVPVLRRALGEAGPDNPRTGIVGLRLRTRDGAWRWVEGQATLRFHLGRAIAVEITGRDVTRTRAAEDTGRRLSSQLEALVAGAPDGIVMVGEDGRIAVINEQACSLLELAMTPEEITGQEPQALFASLRRVLAEPTAAIGRLREVAAAGEPARFISLECADGRRFSCDFVPLRDGGRLWMFRDITPFKLVEQEQREFLATMSHEIKTPLSGIAGAAELLRDANLPARERELAEVIGDAAHALGGLLRDVLDVSRAEAGRGEADTADYDPRRLLSSIAGVLRPSLRDRPLELRIAVHPDVPDVLHGDAARIRQIVLNLASNAVKYTERGVALIDARVDGGRLHITVTDTGRGITPEDLGKLFEPWTRNHGRGWAGTGLGLSIARRLARAMDGDVTVVSELGKGSAFTLDVPLRVGYAAPEAAADDAPALATSRVLVAEDDLALRRLIGMQLERLGIEPVLVEHGQTAVDAVTADGGFDAVLLDLRMPVLGGLEAARAIRALDDEIPLLALTADTAAEDVEHCRAAGMDGHLAKPVSLPALRAELDRRITPVLDEALLEDLAENLGGRALVDQMLGVYHGELAGRLKRLRAAADPDALREAAHVLRSPSAGFGVARLAGRLRRVEALA